MAWLRSMYRIEFAPGSAGAQVLLDWGEDCEDISLPWAQTVLEEGAVGGEYSMVRACGAVRRAASFRVRRTHATPLAFHQAALDADAAMPSGLTAPLEIRLLDLSAATTGTVAQRTASRYRAETAAITSATPAHDAASMATVWAYTVALGALYKLA